MLGFLKRLKFTSCHARHLELLHVLATNEMLGFLKHLKFLPVMQGIFKILPSYIFFVCIYITKMQQYTVKNKIKTMQWHNFICK